MSQTPVPQSPPLDEVMLAMDVVDTLRHRELMVQRELSADERDRQLIDRLREIYAGQGIEVSDAVLERGVTDLRENRFVYVPAAPSFTRTLAHVYVSRSRWVPPLAIAATLIAAAWLGWQVLVRGPQLEAVAALPGELESVYTAVIDLAEETPIDTRADALYRDGQQALARDDYAGARTVVAELDELYATLQQQYELRIVSRAGQLSGVWRIPDDNPNSQNFYLIVEAIDGDGNRLTLPVRNEENGRISRVSQWGQRVDEDRFRAAASDKQDDGIIQSSVIGAKRRGVLEPELQPGVSAGAITDW